MIAERQWARDLKDARERLGLTQRQAVRQVSERYDDLSENTWALLFTFIEGGWVDPRRIAWVLDDFIAESTKGEQS